MYLYLRHFLSTCIRNTEGIGQIRSDIQCNYRDSIILININNNFKEYFREFLRVCNPTLSFYNKSCWAEILKSNEILN